MSPLFGRSSKFLSNPSLVVILFWHIRHAVDCEITHDAEYSWIFDRIIVENLIRPSSKVLRVVADWGAEMVEGGQNR